MDTLSIPIKGIERALSQTSSSIPKPQMNPIKGIERNQSISVYEININENPIKGIESAFGLPVLDGITRNPIKGIESNLLTELINKKYE